MPQGKWEPLDEWEDEVPQRCSICGDTLTGRELGYLPAMCDERFCPGPTSRLRAKVRPVEQPVHKPVAVYTASGPSASTQASTEGSE